MPDPREEMIVRQFRQLMATYKDDLLCDRQLVQQFVEANDEAAFAVLVRRHAGMVLGVCRRVLRDWHAAEDVFQAVFLVLARKASSIRKKDSLGAWLHGVAYRLALKARTEASRRHVRAQAFRRTQVGNQEDDVSWREMCGILDEELARLPEKYRAPLLLCFLEGQTRDEAATRLGWPLGTLKSRLERARELLRQRLVRRGLALSGTLIVPAITENVSSAAVPSSLVVSTAHAALLFAAGETGVGVISMQAATLAKGALSTMLATSLKTASAVLLTMTLVAGGVVLVADEPSSSNKRNQPAPGSEDASPGPFRDITTESGVDFTYRNGEEADVCGIIESIGGGGALIDFDADGRLDLFLVGGGQYAGPKKDQIRGRPCKLFKNLGRGKFKDVTAETGLNVNWSYSHGCAVADYDNDGWPDLLVTGWQQLRLFHNEPVDRRDPLKGRRFVEVTQQAGLPQDMWAASAAWADLDGDGFPDLYVCQHVNWSPANNPTCTSDGKYRDICPPKMFRGRPHKLFRNNGNGTFTDVSNEAGLRMPRRPEDYQKLTHLQPTEVDALKRADANQEYGKGLGVAAVDVDGDGKPDLYVANDTVDNFLYLNVGTPGKIRLREVALQSGTARNDVGIPTGSRGVCVGDYDGSGRPSIFVTNYENEAHSLFHNDCTGGRLLFTFRSQSAGISAIGQKYVGCGATFLDVDNDGWLDLFIANGHTARRAPRAQRPVLLRNLGQGRFGRWMPDGNPYCNMDHVGRGVMVGDFDNDGLVDLVISHANEPVTILRNVAGKDHHWIGFELLGKQRRDLTGARIVVETDGRKQTRFAHGGGSYLSASDSRHVFGLGANVKVDRVTVSWPNGATQEWRQLNVDRYWRLVEGEQQAKPGNAPR